MDLVLRLFQTSLVSHLRKVGGDGERRHSARRRSPYPVGATDGGIRRLFAAGEAGKEEEKEPYKCGKNELNLLNQILSGTLISKKCLQP